MFKKLLSFILAAVMIMSMGTGAFASETLRITNDSNQHSESSQYNIPYNGNEYDELSSSEITPYTTEVPILKWNWDRGEYKFNGSSQKLELFSNYYFSDVVGRTFTIKAGSANRIKVDLMHKGIIFATAVSSWTINAGEEETVNIKVSDLDGKSESGNYYFRFNSNPQGNPYSVTGTFE
ncbi:MAG TPA: hypothetical protein DEF85_02260 [Clostridiaceae bacterium]|nr:hypothetical protein [Clostridiaceae bacterium]HBX47698.1 hypothetical protein [Clostridiaceae bacterium]HCS10759.1 hypothetical protein [Clostridiales bacterium]